MIRRTEEVCWEQVREDISCRKAQKSWNSRKKTLGENLHGWTLNARILDRRVEMSHK